MGSSGDQTLYEDEYYVVLQNGDREIVTLVMPKRRMALEFTFDEWKALQSIVSGISSADIPETGLSTHLPRIFGDSNRTDSTPYPMNTGFMPPLEAQKWFLSPE